MDPKYHKPKKFANLPQLRGGVEFMRGFIRDNLQYPKSALQHQVQGDVIIRFNISDNGKVLDPKVIKSLGFGCDEEALRLLSLLRYDAVKNRGLRVTSHQKIKIPFRLKQVSSEKKINMVYKEKESTPASSADVLKENSSQKTTYNYTIRF